VSRISQSINGIYFAAEEVQNPVYNFTLRDYAKAFQDWEMTSGMIGSQLRAYFPDSRIENEWDNYSEALNDIFNLVLQTTPRIKIEHIQEIQKFLSVGSTIFNKPNINIEQSI
jgi:hypothetical protein